MCEDGGESKNRIEGSVFQTHGTPASDREVFRMMKAFDIRVWWGSGGLFAVVCVAEMRERVTRRGGLLVRGRACSWEVRISRHL